MKASRNYFFIILLLFSFFLSVSGSGYSSTERKNSDPKSSNISRDSQKELEKEFQDKSRIIDEITKSKSQINYRYKHMAYDEIDHTFTLWGDVEIQKQELRFKAQKATYNDWTEEFELIDEVEIFLKEDRLTGTRAVYNHRTQTGYIENATGELSPDVIFECDLLEILPPDPKTGNGLYRIINGMFTSCEGSGRAPWRIKCSEATAHRDNYIQLSHPRFEILNIPILWMPYWIHPIKPSRSTGFLFPAFSRHSELGFHVEPGFFWAINDHVDTTFYLNYYSNFILEQTSRFRYAVSDLSQGDLNFVVRKERVDQIDGPGRSDSVGAEFKYEIKHAMPGGFRLRGYGDLFTEGLSEQYFYDSRTYRQRPTTIESNISFSKNWSGKDNIQIILRDNKNITENGYRWQTLPQVTYSRFSTEFFNPNLRYGVYFNYTNSRTLYEDESKVDTSLGSANFRPSLEYNWNVSSWLIVVPKVLLYEDYFSERQLRTLYDRPSTSNRFGTTKNIGDGILRSMLVFESAMKGPIFYKTFEGLYPMGITKLQHKIEPEITFSFTPDFDQNEIPGTGYINPSKSVNFKLTNRLMGKKEKENAFELLEIDISTRYDFWKNGEYNRLENLYKQNPEIYVDPDRYTKPWDDIRLNFRVGTPLKRTSIVGSFSWDPYYGGIESTSMTFNAVLNHWNSNFSWTRYKLFSIENEPVSNSFQFAGFFDVSRSFQFQLRSTVSLNEDTTTGVMNFSCRYMPSCWGINLFVDRYIGSTGLANSIVLDNSPNTDIWNIGFSFELRNVGSVKAPGLESFRVQ
ncbi:MAG: hypothetical protein A2161_05365 [Candidatus Schekmanbacteria bacterium RBG_13_48_7]|uniref:LPS-assembly protein LptD central domain-containing protein n=1 Tax=Candidatus Schekmanbacteria bacterium RBG_13_48_7 TaxID=1817878 RepID=A0A1F7S1A4_9BACT|nr:MAG: hypothetical protein A2161_05365 [Candidatus Schekmanbacteria bacterium RBG_13_48_7]